MNEAGACRWPEPPAAGPLGDGRHASARLRPGSVADLCSAVRDGVRSGMALYPQGGATAIDYGGPPARPGVLIDTRGLDRVIDYPHADMTITVEAGITAAELATVLAAKDQRLLVEVPQADRATLGGVFATGVCGPRRFAWGRPRDQIIGVRFVTSEGVEVKGGGRVVKNVAGYDLPKLLTGSLGTLGILTSMTLKVRPRPESSAVAWTRLDPGHDLEAILAGLNTTAARPVAVEILDAHSAAIVGEDAGLPAAQRVLAVGFEGSADSVRWQLDRLEEELPPGRVTRAEGDGAERLWAGLTEFQVQAPGPVSVVVAMRPSRVAWFLDVVDGSPWTFQCHAGDGIVRLHGLDDPGEDAMAGRIESLRGLAREADGTLIVPRCPTAWKPRLRVWGDPRPDWGLAAKVKHALDPDGALNPGRFVGST
ncbi:putative FAD-linked oxidoreductase [Aquisphaera giovannonii]|uniref:Putative FAD-linked oxidoreductase n=1 Tax=Aquisphaera giovannonii TaxID=406548 RepID=A0A5B9WA06_9BACT|nr:FAD-binding oxidoreductase [Aquisphaera giovannonii]QEH36690.1 putative FAD-linked oxidoreductase [Aquisphaera giovannonii]